MQFFSNEFINFFNKLENNNNRDWFNENKKEFTSFVKEPFEIFIEALINEIKEVDENIVLTPKEAIFRIYKDVRFSKDKTPYKTNVSAVISEGGRKDFTSPGIYLELSNSVIRFYGGAHFLARNQLQNLREFIADNLDEFHLTINDKKFKKYFGVLLGEKNKRIPSEFKELNLTEPLIANKQFYFLKSLSVKEILSKNLLKTIMDLYHAGKPLNEFLKIGMN
ncbi:MAG: DUF2461 domain-containing protein [Melioribacteraceae bacterium]|jgi:uncharacterized protein (TIGR02453 family)|nr:DUF2461 domain-containing protein [Melioribacteraceae bacterium]